MMGVTPGREKSHIHRVGLDMAIAELNRVVLPDLVVVDATVGMEGNAVDGTPVPMGLLLAGRDPVATDAVCARIIGLSETETKHITHAAELGLGTRDLRRIRIDGPPLRDVARPFEKPWRKLSDLKTLGAECGFDVDAEGACSPCIGCVLMSITALKNRGQLGVLKGIKTVAIGPNARVPPDTSGYLLVGNCLQGFEGAPNHLAGCPPNAHSFFEKLNEMGGDIDFARMRPSKALDPGKP